MKQDQDRTPRSRARVGRVAATSWLDTSCPARETSARRHADAGHRASEERPAPGAGGGTAETAARSQRAAASGGARRGNTRDVEATRLGRGRVDHRWSPPAAMTVPTPPASRATAFSPFVVKVNGSEDARTSGLVHSRMPPGSITRSTTPRARNGPQHRWIAAPPPPIASRAFDEVERARAFARATLRGGR